MAHLTIRFPTRVNPAAVSAQLLCECPVFYVIGDWHQHRLDRIPTAVDYRKTNAYSELDFRNVIDSTLDARKRHGQALHVGVRLSDSTCLEGSFYPAGLLLANLSINIETVRTNDNVEQLCQALERRFPGLTYRIG